MTSPSDSYPTANTVAPPHVPPFMMGKQGQGIGLSQEERKSILNNLTFLKQGCAKRTTESMLCKDDVDPLIVNYQANESIQEY